MSVYAPLLGNLWMTLEAYGVDPRRVIDEPLYRPGQPSNDGDRISFADYDRTLARAASLIDDPAVGLYASEYLHPSHLGALGYAWLSSSSLRAALKRAERFGRMYNEHVELRLDESSNGIRASYRMLSRVTHPELVGDAQLAGLLRLCRINFGESLMPSEVSLKRPEPPDPGAWIRIFGKNVRFGQSCNSLTIENSDADKPLTGSNADLVAIHEEVLRRHLLKLDRNSILNRARVKIMEQLPSGRVTEDTLARSLNVSKRTLHRKLRENNASFRHLLRQVREDLARLYLKNLDYSITEIAFLLGYSDTSSFTRAFNEWFGISPSTAREQLLAG